LNCSVVDSEKVLDQQVLTLDFCGKSLIFVTKTKKRFTIEQKLSVLLHTENLYVFTRDTKRAI
jgi:hypothetical protein